MPRKSTFCGGFPTTTIPTNFAIHAISLPWTAFFWTELPYIYCTLLKRESISLKRSNNDDVSSPTSDIA
jgi:hypothetical protein